MTKFYSNGKIIKILIRVLDTKIKIIAKGENGALTEVRVHNGNFSEQCHCKKKMIELKENLKAITYYFIKLFFLTQKKYSCTRTKLGKLISVVAFKQAVHGQRLFDEPIYKYPPLCGTLIKDLTFIPKDIYWRDSDQPNPDKIAPIDECFDNSVSIPIQYTDFRQPTEQIKVHIEQVFKEFGAYPADVLGKQLNPIVEKIVDTNTDEIDLSRLESMNIADFNISDENDKIVKYIFQ